METKCVFLMLVAFGINLYSSDAAICGWDTVWYNTSTPSVANNFTDTEVTPGAKILDSICDLSAGGRLQIRCQTSKNMSFEIVHNDTSLQYFATCTTVQGLICKPWESVTGASCPDFSIQLGCVCPTTIAPATNPSVASTTQIGVAPGTGNKGGTGNAAGTGTGVGTGVETGSMNSTGNGTGNANGTTDGKGNAGGSGNDSGTTGSGNKTGSFGTQSGSGSSDGNSKSLNSWDRNGSASKERNFIGVWTFLLLTLYSYSM